MSTYTPVASQTLSASASSVTFSNIPQDYTDLVLVVNGQVSTSSQIAIQFNSDTGTNYSVTAMYGDGTSAASGRTTSAAALYGFGWFGNGTQSTSILNIQNYSNSTTYKTVLARGNLSSSYVHAGVGLWRSTSAITSMYIYVYGGYNWNSGTTFSLYGIQAGTPKAQGGQIVTTDGTYWYHAFTSSGTFTPSTAITADVLVVAGGGGGGTDGVRGGGGGAGGIFYATSQSLSANTPYSCVIGAGGTAGPYNVSLNTQGSNSTFGSLTAAIGGGRGGGSYSGGSKLGGSGGSGGGGGTENSSGSPYAGGSSTQTGTGGTGYGNAGGSAGNGGAAGGGGGGAGAAGSNGSATYGIAGAGGAGLNTWSSWATATNTGASGYYAGGGGGGGTSGNGAAGGSGGGGRGGDNSNTEVAGTANTGGGGGGGGSNGNGAAGGSGIVIIRYAV